MSDENKHVDHTHSDKPSIESLQRKFITDMSNIVDAILDDALDDHDERKVEISDNIVGSICKYLEGNENIPGYHVLPDEGEFYLTDISLSPGLKKMFDELNN